MRVTEPLVDLLSPAQRGGSAAPVPAPSPSVLDTPVPTHSPTSGETERGVFVSIRVFSHPADEPFSPPSGTTFSQTTVAFANVANAIAVYDDCTKPLARAQKRGLHAMTDRFKPGPTPRTDAERRADDAHAAPPRVQPDSAFSPTAASSGFAQPD